MDDALSVSPSPAPTPAGKKLLTQAECAELGRVTTARELERLRTTAEYLDRRDEFQQREAALQLAAARHSWMRHTYIAAQAAGVLVLLCACLGVSVVFLANSYPQALGLPGPDSSKSSTSITKVDEIEEPMLVSDMEESMDSGVHDHSDASVSIKTASFEASISMSEDVEGAVFPHATTEVDEPHSVAEMHDIELSVTAASDERSNSLLQVSPDDFEGWSDAPVCSQAMQQGLQTTVMGLQLQSEVQESEPADVAVPSTKQQGELSEFPPSLAASSSDVDSSGSQQQDATAHSEDTAGSAVASNESEEDVTAPSEEHAPPVGQSLPLHSVFGSSSSPSTSQRLVTPGMAAMNLGTDVFWAPVAFKVFCSALAGAIAVVSAAVTAAGSPSIAAAYLLLVVTMIIIAYVFLQPSSPQAGRRERVVGAMMPSAVGHGSHGHELGSRRSPSFQRLLEEPESSEAVIHGPIAHTPSTVCSAEVAPSPWRREVEAMRKRYDKLDRRDENLNMNLTKNMDMLNQMRSQAQSSAAAGASPGLSAEESGSDAENAPCLEESIGGTIANAPGPEDSIGDAFLLEEHDTVCCGHDSEHAAIAEDAPDSQDQDVEDVSIADPQNDPAPETSCAEEDGSALTGADSIGAAVGEFALVHDGDVPSEVEAVSKSAAAAATAMAKLSAGTKGVQTHGRELVERLTKLDAAVHQRRAPCQIAGSAPAEPGESNAGHPSVSESAHSPQVDVEQETERITNVIEEMVGQIGSTVQAARHLAPHVYGPNVDVFIDGKNWHTEARNMMKIAALKLQQGSQNYAGSPVPAAPLDTSPAASRGPMTTPRTVRDTTGSTLDCASPEQLLGQSQMALVVERMLGGALQEEDLNEAVSGLAQPAAAAICSLQKRLREMNAPQVSNSAQHFPPTALSLPLNQQCGAGTPFPTPASAATSAFPNSASAADAARCAAVSSKDLLTHLHEFSSGLGATGVVEAVEVTLQVAASSFVNVHFAACSVSQSSAHTHRLFRSLSEGLNSQETQQRQLPASHMPSPLSVTQPQEPMLLTDVASGHDEAATAFDDADAGLSFLSSAAAPAWDSPNGTAEAGTPNTQPGSSGARRLALHLDTASAAELSQEELHKEGTAESVGETWSMPTPTPLSARDTVGTIGTGASQGLASNVSELYERGFQLEQSIQDIDDRGCFRAGQDTDVAGRPQSAAEGIVELERILCNATVDSAVEADSEDYVFDHKLLEAQVTDAYATAIRNWEDIALTKSEVHAVRRYLTHTMSDIMARVSSPSPSVASSRSQSSSGIDDADAENSGNAASSGQRDKFLSYRYLVGTVKGVLGNVEDLDVRIRHLLAEGVSLKEQLAVARKGYSHLQAELQAHGELPHTEGASANLFGPRRSGDDLPELNSSSRDMLLSQLVTWDPTAPDAPTPANVLRQFREVDRPLAPLAAQMDSDPGVVSDNSLLWKKEQLDDFIVSMSAHSDALSSDLSAAGRTMHSLLSAVHQNTLELLLFFASHSYTPPQVVSTALNKVAAHVSMHEDPQAGTFPFSPAAGNPNLGNMMNGPEGRQSPTSQWIENSAVSGLDSVSSSYSPDSHASGPRGTTEYANCSTQGILTDSNTSRPASACSPAWAGITQPQTRASAPQSPSTTETSPLQASAAAMRPSPKSSPVQFPSRNLPEAPTPSLTFTFGGSQPRSTGPRTGLQLPSTNPNAAQSSMSGPTTNFASPYSNGPLTRPPFLQPPEDTDEGEVTGPASPALSPLLLSVIEQQQQEQQRSNTDTRNDQAAPQAAEQRPSVPSHPVAMSTSAGASGPTSNDSSLSFVQQAADLRIPMGASAAAAAPNNTANAASPAPQWGATASGPFSPAGATSASIAAAAQALFPASGGAPFGATTSGPGKLPSTSQLPAFTASAPTPAASPAAQPIQPFTFGACANAGTAATQGLLFSAGGGPVTSPFQASGTALPSKSAGDLGSAKSRTSFSEDGSRHPDSRLPRRPSRTGNSNFSSRASSTEGLRNDQQQPLSPLRNKQHSGTFSDAECNRHHAQAVQQPSPPVPPTTGDSSVAPAPLAMQGSVAPAASNASSAMLPPTASISFAGSGIAISAAADVAPPGPRGLGSQTIPPLTLPVDFQEAACEEEDALLPEEEAQGIVDTFPGLSPPIPSPTEPTVGPSRPNRATQENNPLREGFDFSSKPSPQHVPLPDGPTWPLSQASNAPADSHGLTEGDNSVKAVDMEPVPAQLPQNPKSPCESSRSEALAGGISDLSLPRNSSPGTETQTPRDGALQMHEKPWEAVHCHTNALFSDQSPEADASRSGGASEAAGAMKPLQFTPVSAQKLTEGREVEVTGDAPRRPSPDENACENLPFLSK